MGKVWTRRTLKLSLAALLSATVGVSTRPVRAASATEQTVSNSHSPDLTHRRWITNVALSGIGTWQFGEDSKGRIAEVLNPHGQYTSRQFDPDGKLTKETKANGTVSNYSYTTRDWLAGIEHRLANGTVLDNFQYYYTTATGTAAPCESGYRERLRPLRRDQSDHRRDDQAQHRRRPDRDQRHEANAHPGLRF